MGQEIRHSLPDHVERNMEPGRTHNRNVHSQSSSGWEGVGQRWVAPNMRYSHPGRGGPNMEHGRTDHTDYTMLNYQSVSWGIENEGMRRHHDVSEVPIVGHGGHTTEPVSKNNREE